MSDKLGPYIQKLMVTVIDKEQDDFVQKLALDELRRLNVNINSFIHTNTESEENVENKSEKTEKQLLQEDK